MTGDTVNWRAFLDSIDVDILICPLTKQPIEEPVIAFDGQTYEKNAIQRYFETNTISPITGECMEDPNIRLRFIHNARLSFVSQKHL